MEPVELNRNLSVSVSEENIVVCRKCNGQEFVLAAKLVAFQTPIIGQSTIVTPLKSSGHYRCLYCNRPLDATAPLTLGEINRKKTPHQSHL